MVNNDINERSTRLIEPDQQISNAKNDNLSKRSPMLYMNQQAVATYEAIKKQDLLEPQLASRSKMRR